MWISPPRASFKSACSPCAPDLAVYCRNRSRFIPSARRLRPVGRALRMAMHWGMPPCTWMHWWTRCRIRKTIPAIPSPYRTLCPFIWRPAPGHFRATWVWGCHRGDPSLTHKPPCHTFCTKAGCTQIDSRSKRKHFLRVMRGARDATFRSGHLSTNGIAAAAEMGVHWWGFYCTPVPRYATVCCSVPQSAAVCRSMPQGIGGKKQKLLKEHTAQQGIGLPTLYWQKFPHFPFFFLDQTKMS